MQANRRLVTLGSTFAAAMMISTLIAPTVGAAQARLTFGVEWDGLQIGSNCVAGQGAVPETTVRLVWKNASGGLKVRTDVTASPGSGYLSYCSDTAVIAIGDVFKLTDEQGSRSYTMPNVTMIADRVHDEFRGKGPANSAGQLCYHAGLFADYYQCEEIATDSSGSWLSRPEYLDLIGGIDAEINFESSKGDYLYASRHGPMDPGHAWPIAVRGGSNAFQSVSASVRDASTNAIKGRGTAVGNNYGAFTGEFVDADGDPVAVAAGDRIKSAIASDANWIVPNIDGSANVATDFVYGRCFGSGSDDSAWVTVYRVTGEFRGFSMAYMDETGAFEINFSKPSHFMFDHANIKHGDRVSIRCLQTTGDVVQLSFRVP